MTHQPDFSPSEGGDERLRVRNEIADRLRGRGVRVTGQESAGELSDLLDAVERFEAAVEGSGGDLMMDEPIGTGSPIQPDNAAFVLPRRKDGETVDAFIERIAFATTRARGKHD